MHTDYLLDRIPLWGIFLITVAIVLLSVAVGNLLGSRRKRRSPDGEAAPVGAIAAAAVGLLAFLLAFTFEMAASRFDARKGLVIEDANAIGTTYLRAELLPEPYSERAQVLLREYVDIRVEGVRTMGLAKTLARSQELHQLLWSQAVAAGEEDPHSITVGLFIRSLNEMIDIHQKRVTEGLHYRIPVDIYLALYLVTILGMASMGYYVGLDGSRGVFVVVCLAIAFSIVMTLIVDLDRSQKGLVRVSQAAMADVRESILRDTLQK